MRDQFSWQQVYRLPLTEGDDLSEAVEGAGNVIFAPFGEPGIVLNGNRNRASV